MRRLKYSGLLILLLMLNVPAVAQHFALWSKDNELSRIDSALRFYDQHIKKADTLVADAELNRLLSTAQEENWPEIECLVYSMRGNKWARVNHSHPKAELNHILAIERAQALHLPNIQAMVQFRYGLYKYSGKYVPQALVQMLLAEDLAKELPDGQVPYYGEQLYHCGRALYDISDRKRASALIAKALKYPFHRPFYKLQALNTLGLCQYREKQWEQALLSFRQALNLDTNEVNAYWRCLLHKNIADVYFSRGMADSAIAHYQISYSGRHLIADEYLRGNMWFISSLCLARMFQHTRPDLFTRYLEEAQLYLKYAEGTTYRLELLALRAAHATAVGKLDVAQSCWQAYQRLSDTTASTLAAQYYDHTHLLIDTEKELASVNGRLQQEAYQKKLRGWLLVGLLGVLCLSAVIFWQQLRHRSTRLKLSQEQLFTAKKTEELAALRAQQAEAEQIKLQELLALQQALTDAQQKEKEAAYRELVAVNTLAAQRKDLIAKIKGAITAYPTLSRQLQALLEKVQDTQSHDQEWEQYRLDFLKLHPDFFNKLEERGPELTPYDMRLAAYIKMGLSGKEIAQLLNVIEQTVHNSRYRLRKKLGLETGQDLVTFLADL